MYFKLPKKEYGNLNHEQLLARISDQLSDFVLTEKFKTSFLAKASVIIFEPNAKKIWMKE